MLKGNRMCVPPRKMTTTSKAGRCAKFANAIPTTIIAVSDKVYWDTRVPKQDTPGALVDLRASIASGSSVGGAHAANRRSRSSIRSPPQTAVHPEVGTPTVPLNLSRTYRNGTPLE